MANVWKIAPGPKAKNWEMCRQRACIVINWLNETNLEGMSKEDILRSVVDAKDGKVGSARSIWKFVNRIDLSDVVVANDGIGRVVGIGVVKSKYLPPDDPKNPNRDEKNNRQVRLVDWLIDKPIDLETNVFVQSTVTLLRPEQCDQIKQACLKKYPELRPTLEKLFPSKPPPRQPDEPALQSEEATMKALLEQLGQIIVYGPPGTGKTREAKRVALTLLTGKDSPADVASTDNDIEKQLKPFRDGGRFDLVVFHPAYEYEQFVGGIEPTVIGQQLSFKAKAGVFTRLCRKAQNDNQPAVLIIDEINRGNLPKLLGELVYALEYRGHEVTLPFVVDGRTDLIVPKNLYVIATMNSSDRSIGHIDVAIRRRFGLYPLGARPEVVQQVWASAGDESYGRAVGRPHETTQQNLSGHDPSAGVELGVGHSYFLPAHKSMSKKVEAAKKQVQMKWDYQVQPLLREYAQLLNLGANSLQEFFKPLNQCLDQP